MILWLLISAGIAYLIETNKGSGDKQESVEKITNKDTHDTSKWHVLVIAPIVVAIFLTGYFIANSDLVPKEISAVLSFLSGVILAAGLYRCCVILFKRTNSSNREVIK